MLIELIGCSNAGKTTLAGKVLQECQEQGIDMILAEDFVLQQLRLNGIKDERTRKAFVNGAGMVASLAAWRTLGPAVVFSTRLLRPLPVSSWERVGLLRNVMKRLGVSQIVRDRRGEKQIVLYDEGPLHNAHNLFVHLSSEPQLDAIHRFVRLTPLPDLVVYVKEAEPVLIERIIKRGHRRIADLSAENVARFVRRATATFDELVQDPAVQRRLMVVAAGQQAALPRGAASNAAMGDALDVLCGLASHALGVA